MRGRRLQIDWQEDEQTLYNLYKKEKDAQRRTRLHALWLLRKGHSLREAARIVGVHYRTLQDWVAWYRLGGLDEVLRRRHGGHGGRKSRLTPQEEARLKELAYQGEIRTIWDGVIWAKEMCGVPYTYWGMRWVFARLNLRKKVPRPIATQASVEAQEEWKRGGLAAELRQVGAVCVSGIAWGDEMRVGLIGQVRRVWAPRGVKVRQRVERQYEWAYLNLAVNGLEGKLYWCWTPNMKQEATVEVVKEWREKGISVLIWDRAPSHRARQVREVGVRLIEQPSYAPELNPSERVFEEIRRRVEGEVYGDIEKKKAVIEREMQRLAADPERVKSLAGWAWIREAVNNLSIENTAFQ